MANTRKVFESIDEELIVRKVPCHTESDTTPWQGPEVSLRPVEGQLIFPTNW